MGQSWEGKFGSSNGGNDEPQISSILQHPGMSDWLKQALRDAAARDPDAVLNDLEILDLVLRTRVRRTLAKQDAQFSWLNVLIW